MDQSGCIQRPGQKTAAGTLVYLVEELGDARMRCDQLVRYVDEGVKLLENTPEEIKERFMESAGHLTQAIPETLFKLHKALQAVALAATRMDYEEIKDDLRPEKVDELERVLQDVRLRHVRRRSQPWDLATFKAVAHQVSLLQGELSNMEQKMAGNQWKVAYDWTSHLSQEVMQLASPNEVREKFKEQNPKLDDAALDEIVGQWMKNKDVVKDKSAAKRPTFDVAKKSLLDHLSKEGWKISSPTLKIPHATDRNGEVRLWFKTQAVYMSIVKGRGGSHTMDGARSIHVDIRDLTPEQFMSKVDQWSKQSSSKTASAWKVSCEDTKQSRHEEGKPADPTKDMSPEDAAKWEQMNEEHGDKFKAAADDEYTGKLYVIWVTKDGKRHKEGPFSSTDRYREARKMLSDKLSNPEVKSVNFERASKLASDVTAGEPRGKAQTAIMEYLDSHSKAELNDMTRAPSLRGVHLKDIMSAAEALKKGGHINYDGKTLSKKASVTAAAPSADRLKGAVESIEKACKDIKHHLTKGDKMPEDDVAQLLNSIRSTSATMLRRMGKTASDDDKQSKFEEGKPADPTENMSPEDKATWKEEHEKNKDNFKAAAWKVNAAWKVQAALTGKALGNEAEDLAATLMSCASRMTKVEDGVEAHYNDADGRYDLEDSYSNAFLDGVRKSLDQTSSAMKDSARKLESLHSVLAGKKPLPGR